MHFNESAPPLQTSAAFGALPLNFIGKIRDPLHDTIAMTAAEKAIIDTPEFQRLRRISQTAFIKYVFPGANHSRFEHSLGVMHLSGIMLASLVANQRKMVIDLKAQVAELPENAKEDFARREDVEGSILQTESAVEQLQSSPYLSQCLRFAALLHDVGHSPFSHSGERFLPTWGELEAQFGSLQLPAYLVDGLKAKLANLSKQNPRAKNISLRHEVYTLFIIQRIFNKNSEFLNAQMGQDVCALIDTNVKPAKNSPLEKSGLQRLLHEIVSGELDVDRMDYLMRDSRHCGVVYGLFDAARILDSACFYFDRATERYHLSIRKRGVPALEDYLRARWSMYQQVYFHKTSTACEAMLESVYKQLSDLKIPLKVEEYLKLDDFSFCYFVEKEVGNNPNGQYAINTLRDLVYNRKLWKRVYEESHPKASTVALPSLCPTVQMLLKKHDIANEMIESGTSLTRFSPKSRQGHRSQNTLKVVVKDLHGLRYLEPIENHSQLVNRVDEETLVKRIFVSLTKKNGESIEFKDIRQLVSNGIVTTPYMS